jgi:hypothetical protein
MTQSAEARSLDTEAKSVEESGITVMGVMSEAHFLGLII